MSVGPEPPQLCEGGCGLCVTREPGAEPPDGPGAAEVPSEPHRGARGSLLPGSENMSSTWYDARLPHVSETFRCSLRTSYRVV